MLEKLTGYTFNVKDDSCDETGIDGKMLVQICGAVGGAVGVALVAIALIWVIWKMIGVIFRCCCGRRRTMKAPGRNRRILRADFERNPAAYFRNLHND
ncbi:unnamed protein product [Sphenostylis stenocarpa]|nr:unnamed protein product [Sphenostylis stenocarpa]